VKLDSKNKAYRIIFGDGEGGCKLVSMNT